MQLGLFYQAGEPLPWGRGENRKKMGWGECVKAFMGWVVMQRSISWKREQVFMAEGVRTAGRTGVLWRPGDAPWMTADPAQ